MSNAKRLSLLNDVIGPVMRGPSSSHTAAPYYIGRLARALLGDEPAEADFVFDPGGSFAEVYHQQGSDLGLASGLLGWAIDDERFSRAVDLAAGQGLRIAFTVAPLPGADHPNTLEMRLLGRQGRRLEAMAQSIGGGQFVLAELDGWPVQLRGDAHDVLVELKPGAEPAAHELLAADGQTLSPAGCQERDGRLLLHARRGTALDLAVQARLAALPGVRRVWAAPPVLYVQRGEALFSSAAEMVAVAEARGWSLGQAALAYEATLLGVPAGEVQAEMLRRFEVMRAAVQRGLSAREDFATRLVVPSAGQVYRAEAEGRVAAGGLHTRAAARAMAVMHVNGAGGVVCAAPTAGSAGVLAGVAVTLGDEWALSQESVTLALFAAGAVGLVLGTRATFAAEVAGCQVEIGASGAMAAAAVVEAAGGSARQAAGAAAIALQNTMGSTCDPVQGIVEIPCHTRNAAAAASAFVCADLILGGYVNPIPLDETVDAAYAVGLMLPRELRCTALGGLSLAPSALALRPRG